MRNLTLKELILAILGVVYLLTAMAVKELYSKPLGIGMLAVVIVIAIISFFSMSAVQKNVIDQKIKEHEQTGFGQLMKFLGYALYGILGIGLLMWLLNKVS